MEIINKIKRLYSRWVRFYKNKLKRVRNDISKIGNRLGFVALGVFLFIIAIGIAGVLFVKFNTGAAANFTDNVLRPALGNKTVAFFEKIYFNSTDKIQQLTDKTGLSKFPQFLDNGIQSTSTPIPVENGLTKVSGEGIWRNRTLKLFPNKEIMAYTFVRPDPSRPFAYVTLVQIDMKQMKLMAVAGTKQPGGPIGNFGPGVIPTDIVSSGKLVAAFEGGFQYRDGNYGMIVNGKIYVPLRLDVGTLIGYKDGSLKIVDYQGQDFGKNVDFVRQNCPMLVENGQVFALNERNKKLWGRTFNSDIYTWRSGLGLTREGNLIYAVGNNLAPETLAKALQMAGAVNAIQLDINPFWVRFNIFEPNGNGTYVTSTLTKDLKDGSKGFLTGYSKDFFYIYKK